MKTMLGLMGFSIALLAVGGALAQAYPNKTVRVVVGYPPGISPDITARAVTTEISKRLGQPFVIENRTGANGSLATSAVAKAPADGYTIFGGSITPLHPVLSKTNPVVGGKDLSPIGDYAELPQYFMVRGGIGARTLAELVAYAKANPGKLNFASSAATHDLALEVVKARTGLTATSIRFRAPPATEMLGGQVDFMLGSYSLFTAQIQAGQVFVLFGTGARRVDSAPTVPTSTEVGLPLIPAARQGLWGPPGMPADMRQKLSSEIAVAVKTQSVTETWQKLSLVHTPPNSPDEQQSYYDAAIAVYVEGARLAKYEPE